MTPLDACPSDYVEEKETNGCIPRFPLIMATREGRSNEVAKLLADDEIDFYSCDRHGKTAWYYAQHGHSQRIRDLLEDRVVQINLLTCAKSCLKSRSKEKITLPSPRLMPPKLLLQQKGNKLDQLMETISCSTLAHPRSSTPMLLLLLLLLPVFLGNSYLRQNN